MENLRVEYKSQLSREVLDGLDSDIAAYANAKGGEIWFGVDAKGRPTGIRLTEVDQQRVAQKAACCRPPVQIDFEERGYESHQITAVIVPESASIHADGRHRFPIRIGGIKDYLDATAVLLLAREKGLEFVSSQVGFGWSPTALKDKREELPRDTADHYVAALNSSNAIVRAEALKDLDTALYRYCVERESRIMESLLVLSSRLSEPGDGRPLDLLRYILLQASDEDRLRWVSRVREKALNIYRATRSAFAVQQALNLLSQFPELEDVETILWAISTWPKELYTQARPLTWLTGLKSEGHLFPVQHALFRRLEQIEDAEIVERVKECLEHLRRN